MSAFNIQERDLDLMILEELHSDRGFAEWLAARLGYAGARFICARHSVSVEVNGKWGESDVVAYFEYDQETLVVLIEDNIESNFTERQAERYHERANHIISEGLASIYIVVLVAPDLYIKTISDKRLWNICVSIEEIISWFLKYDDHHARWRVDILSEILARVVKAKSDRRRELEFSTKLSAFLQKEYSDLSHNPTGDVAYLLIRHEGLKGPFEIYWNVRNGMVNLRVSGTYLGRVYRIKLIDRFSIRSTKVSDIVSLPVGSASWDEPFERQIEVARNVVAACQMLLQVVASVCASSDATAR